MILPDGTNSYGTGGGEFEGIGYEYGIESLLSCS